MIWHQFKHRISHQKFLAFIGLAGVSSMERSAARRVGIFFNYMLVIVAILMLLQWHTYKLDEGFFTYFCMAGYAITLYFLFQLVICIMVCRDKWRYLCSNWCLPVLALYESSGCYLSTIHHLSPAWWLALRPVFAVLILLPAGRLMMRFFLDGQLKTTLLAAAVVVIIFGLLVAGIDPGIGSLWDGIWWAVVTVSTVGYGDVVPTSAFGRLLGVGLIIMGLGIFVVITANFLALILRKEVSANPSQGEHLRELTELMHELIRSQQASANSIEVMHHKIRALEQKLIDKSL